MSRLTYDLPALVGAQSYADIPVTDAVPTTERLFVECPEDRGVDILSGLYEKLKTQGVDCSDIGGVSVRLGDAWWRIRLSTQKAKLVARCGGATSETYLQALNHLRCQLLSFGLRVVFL